MPAHQSTEADQTEAARELVRKALLAADNGNHAGEQAVLRMAGAPTSGPWLCVYCDLAAGECTCDNERNPCRFTQRIKQPVSGLVRQALERARHDLVCTSGLRATDQTVDQFAEKIAAGVPREELEFTIDNSATVALCDAALAEDL